MHKILVVEDDADNVEIMEQFLGLCQFQVVVARDGPSGVALAVSERPDLILMDLGLPLPEDGLVATREIRARAGTETIPIIALTARNMPGDIERAREAGCTDFESKPFDFDHLHDKIRQHLTQRSSQ
jgi:two-component system, cell cycle response regulator DivK